MGWFLLFMNSLMNSIHISLCSGAEYLFQIVHGAVPQVYLEPNSSASAAEVAVHILDHLYKKLDEVCLVQGGEVVTIFLAPILFSSFLLLLLVYTIQSYNLY